MCCLYLSAGLEARLGLAPSGTVAASVREKNETQEMPERGRGLSSTLSMVPAELLPSAMLELSLG